MPGLLNSSLVSHPVSAEEVFSHSSKILCRCRQQKLIMGTAGSAQAQLAKFEDTLEVGEQYFYLLPFSTRLAISLGLANCARQIACRLVGAAVNFAGYHVGAAPRFKFTWPTVAHAGSIAKRSFRLAALRRLQIFASTILESLAMVRIQVIFGCER